MSWKETCPMNERVRFIGELLAEERSMSELCTLYGVSRKTGCKWLARYEAAGATGSPIVSALSTASNPS